MASSFPTPLDSSPTVRRFGALLARLRDQALPVRLASLEALLALPLAEEEWREVAGYVGEVLDADEGAWPERDEVMALAPRVPVRSVRERLAALAVGGGRDALPAAMALAAAHDTRGAIALIEAADRGNVGAAESLASIDVTGPADRVREMLHRLARPPVPTTSGTAESRAALQEAGDVGLLRFWLALALARAGDDAQLGAFVEDYRAGRVELPLFWGQPEIGWAQIRAGGAIPAVLRDLGVAGAEEAE